MFFSFDLLSSAFKFFTSSLIFLFFIFSFFNCICNLWITMFCSKRLSKWGLRLKISENIIPYYTHITLFFRTNRYKSRIRVTFETFHYLPLRNFRPVQYLLCKTHHLERRWHRLFVEIAMVWRLGVSDHAISPDFTNQPWIA